MSDFFGGHDIPKGYGTCPRCGGQLFADVYECASKTGAPTETGFHVWCKKSHDDFHEALAEASETGNHNLVRSVEQCEWSYGELLIASRDAYSYLKNLRN